MAIGLENNPNTTPPDADYPFGNIKDNPGNNTGTPLNTFVHADFHQFFRKLLSAVSIIPNGLAENVTNTYQYFLALIANIRATFATETDRGTAEIATTAETNAGIDDARMITPLKLAGRTATETRVGLAEIATLAEVLAGVDNARIITPLKLNQVGITSDWAIYTIPAGNITPTSGVIINKGGFLIYKIIGKTLLYNLLVDFEISVSASPLNINIDLSTIFVVANDGLFHRTVGIEFNAFQMVMSSIGGNSGIMELNGQDFSGSAINHVDVSGVLPIQ